MELARALHQKKWRVGVACTCGPAALRIRREGFSVFPVEFCRESLNPWAVFRSLSQIQKAVSEFRPDLLAAVALRPILLLPLLRTCPTPATVNLLNGLGSLASGAHLPLRLRPASWWLRSLLGLAISRANCWTVTQNEADYQEARRFVSPTAPSRPAIPWAYTLSFCGATSARQGNPRSAGGFRPDQQKAPRYFS